MFRWELLAGAITCLFALGACTIDDADRCPKGYFFVKESNACCRDTYEFNGTRCVPKPQDTGSNDSDAGSDGDGGADTNISGLGADCSTNEDCADYEADFCLPTLFKCTIVGCVAGQCNSGFICCGRCMGSDEYVCVADDYKKTAFSLGCDCL